MPKRKLRHFFHLHIDGGIHEIHILPIQFLPEELNGLPEALEMNDLPLPEKTDHIVDIGIVAEPQDVVVGYPSLLL